MVLSLITPQGSNFLKNFPGQNAANLDRIDTFSGPAFITHPLQSFTPALISAAGTASNPNLGTGGFNKGFMYRIFDQIHLWGEFRFGTSGISAGSDIYIVTIPFEVKSTGLLPSTVISAAPVIGVGTVHDNSSNAGRLPLTVHLRTSTQLMFGVRMNSGLGNRELRSSGYITWDVNDGVSWTARFQIAS